MVSKYLILFAQLILLKLGCCRLIDLSSFTIEEADSEHDESLHKIDPIVAEFNDWFVRARKTKMVKFKIGLAQEYAKVIK
jgi:hypothetical protein